MLSELIVSILAKHPADQYSLHRQTGASMNQVTRAIVELQQKRLIHVAKYRKDRRTGLRVPIYSLQVVHRRYIDVQSLLAGVTSERLVEYAFVAKNIPPRSKKVKILDIGAAGSGLAEVLRNHGKNWHVLGIDIEPGTDLQMDARTMGFRSRVFDQVISVSAIEHIGFDDSDENGDEKTMKEIFRILKNGGRALITLPYGKETAKYLVYRVYNRKSLASLVHLFKVVKEQYHIYRGGKWVCCTAAKADSLTSLFDTPSNFHSNACACLVLQKQ